MATPRDTSRTRMPATRRLRVTRLQAGPFWATELGGRHVFFLMVVFLVGWGVVGITSTTERNKTHILADGLPGMHVLHSTEVLMTVP